MRLSGELSTPLGWIDDPLACGLHVAAALGFAWTATRLVRRAGEARRRAAALALFAGSTVVVLAISATYHALPVAHGWKLTLQRLDHSAIFLLIAGTLTAYHAVGFRGVGRWWMVGAIWLFAGTALLGKIAWWSTLGDGVGLALYIGLSALGLSSILFLPRRLPWHAFAPMAAGAAVYVTGALLDYGGIVWLVPGVVGPHEIFHVAVVAALMLHWRFFHEWALPGRVAVPAVVPALQRA
jgi:channel protein (hemolysin III family)